MFLSSKNPMQCKCLGVRATRVCSCSGNWEYFKSQNHPRNRTVSNRKKKWPVMECCSQNLSKKPEFLLQQIVYRAPLHTHTYSVSMLIRNFGKPGSTLLLCCVWAEKSPQLIFFLYHRIKIGHNKYFIFALLLISQTPLPREREFRSGPCSPWKKWQCECMLGLPGTLRTI